MVQNNDRVSVTATAPPFTIPSPRTQKSVVRRLSSVVASQKQLVPSPPHRTLTALAEPNRLRIVEYLRGGPRPVGEIAGRLRLRQPQVSKHLKVLSEAGLVTVKPLAQQRIYQLQPKPFKELDTWIDTFKRIWDKRLDALDDYLKELKEKEKKSGGEE